MILYKNGSALKCSYPGIYGENKTLFKKLFRIYMYVNATTYAKCFEIVCIYMFLYGGCTVHSDGDDDFIQFYFFYFFLLLNALWNTLYTVGIKGKMKSIM